LNTSMAFSGSYQTQQLYNGSVALRGNSLLSDVDRRATWNAHVTQIHTRYKIGLDRLQPKGHNSSALGRSPSLARYSWAPRMVPAPAPRPATAASRLQALAAATVPAQKFVPAPTSTRTAGWLLPPDAEATALALALDSKKIARKPARSSKKAARASAPAKAAPQKKPWQTAAPTQILTGKLRKLQELLKDHIDLNFHGVHEAYLHIDDGHRGYITKEELLTTLLNWNIDVKKETVDALFDVIVPNGSNKMDYASFAKCLTHQHMSKQIFGLNDDETGAVHHITSGQALTGWGGQMYLNTALEVDPLKKHGSRKHDYLEPELVHAMKGHEVASKRELMDEEKVIRQHVDTKFKRMKDAFLMFDEDHSGYISKKELEMGIRHLNLPIPQEHINQILNDVDTNPRGEIDYDHFVKVFHEDTHQAVDIFGKGEEVEDNILSFADPNHTGHGHLHVKRLGPH